MAQIEYGNRFSRLSGTYPLQLIDNILAVHQPGYYWSQAYKKRKWDGKKHFYSFSTGIFPSGLLPLVLSVLHSANCPINLIDCRTLPKEYSDYSPLIKEILRDYQLEAIDEMLKIGRGIIHHATGSGKTYTLAGIFDRCKKYNCLYISHRIELLFQTRKKFIELGFDKNDIGIIGAGNSEYKRFTLASCQSLHSMIKSIDFEEIASNTTCLCGDEIHTTGAAKTFYNVLMKIDAPLRFGFSGTPFKEDQLQNYYVMAATGPVISRKSSEDLIKEGKLTQPILNFLSYKSPYFDQWETYHDLYDQGIVQCEERNKLIKSIVEKTEEEKLKTLILVRRIAHGEYLKEYLNIPFVHGNCSPAEREQLREEFTNKESGTLIASTIFDEGISIDDINVLIIASGGKSDTKTIQRIGRGLRKKEGKLAVLVYDFLDEHNRHLSSHSNKRKKLCEKEFNDIRVLDEEQALKQFDEFIEVQNSLK